MLTSKLNSVKKESSTSFQNDVVIGILAQKVTDGSLLAKKYPELLHKPFIVLSYQSFIESTKAKVLLINCNIRESKARKIYDAIHGILLPGGAASLKNSNYSKLASLFLKWSMDDVKHKRRYFPIFGVCLGFQFLLRKYESKDENCLSCTMTRYYNLNLRFHDNAYKGSKLFQGMSQETDDILTTQKVTFNSHKYSLTSEGIQHHPGIMKMFNVLAMSVDPKTQVEFVAAVEAKDYPLYGVQWHPEKNAHESHPTICHTHDAVLASKHFIDFFVKEAIKDGYVPTTNFKTLVEPTSIFHIDDVIGINNILIFSEK